jgi:hypothetical protein
MKYLSRIECGCLRETTFAPAPIEQKGRERGDVHRILTGGLNLVASLNILPASFPLLPGTPGTRRLYFWTIGSLNMHYRDKIRGVDLSTPQLLTSRFRNRFSPSYRDLTNSHQRSVGLLSAVAVEVAGIPGTLGVFVDTAFRRIRPAAVGLETLCMERGSEEEALEVS